MKRFITYSALLFCALILLSSCESEAERKQRKAKEEQQRFELEAQRKREVADIAFQKEIERAEREKREEAERIESEKIEEAKRIEQEARLELERQEKTIYNKYINNSLYTGATPYAYCFGGNSSCPEYGCSQIKVRTPSDSDVIVTIKRYGEVYRHAYIKAGSQYTFEFPNGTYQPFFYYGKGWNPEKVMKETDCGLLRGGFIEAEHFGKDDPQTLSNNILEYKLILQQNGNFSTRPSNPEEAF